MKKINKLVLDGEAAAVIFKASADLGFPPYHILEACINHGLSPALKTLGNNAVNYQPGLPTEPAPTPAAPRSVVNDVPVVRKSRGRPRAITVYSTPSAPAASAAGGSKKRGRPRKTDAPVSAATDGTPGKRRGRPPGAKNKSSRAEAVAVAANGSDVTEV